MSGKIYVETPGLLTSIQDFGRFGYRQIGVPVSGALDRVLLAAANYLAQGEDANAGLEIIVAGPTLRVAAGPVRLALAGDIEARVEREGATADIAPWSGVALRAGDILRLGAVRTGVAYVGFSGGLQIEKTLGSASTYARARLGGVGGRPLAGGDVLQCRLVDQTECETELRAPPFVHAPGPIRVMLGPQDDHFSANALETLLNAEFRANPNIDRMGLRLEGPALSHNDKGADIASDGVTPGAIQVPGDGMPIVLMADCQTCGGYSKIATAIGADLPRLGHIRPGDVLRFRAVDADQAEHARAQARETLARWRASVFRRKAAGSLDLARLYSENLIGGAISGEAD